MFRKIFSNKMLQGGVLVAILVISIFLVHCSNSKVTDIDNPQYQTMIYFQDAIVDSLELTNFTLDTATNEVSVFVTTPSIAPAVNLVKFRPFMPDDIDSGWFFQVLNGSGSSTLWQYDFKMDDYTDPNWLSIREIAEGDFFEMRYEIDGDTIRETFYQNNDSLPTVYHERFIDCLHGDTIGYNRSEIDFADSLETLFVNFYDTTLAFNNNYHGEFATLLLLSDDFWNYVIDRVSEEYHLEGDQIFNRQNYELDGFGKMCVTFGAMSQKCWFPPYIENPICVVGLSGDLACVITGGVIWLVELIWPDNDDDD